MGRTSGFGRYKGKAEAEWNQDGNSLADNGLEIQSAAEVRGAATVICTIPRKLPDHKPWTCGSIVSRISGCNSSCHYVNRNSLINGNTAAMSALDQPPKPAGAPSGSRLGPAGERVPAQRIGANGIVTLQHAVLYPSQSKLIVRVQLFVLASLGRRRSRAEQGEREAGNGSDAHGPNAADARALRHVGRCHGRERLCPRPRNGITHSRGLRVRMDGHASWGGLGPINGRGGSAG
jgi:hypothetical protein